MDVHKKDKKRGNKVYNRISEDQVDTKCRTE
jgi:hypothetical protein